MESEINRLQTFARYPSSAVKSAYSLANNGFYLIGGVTNDKVQCYFCKQSKVNWQSDEDITEVHSSMSPNCPMVTGEKSDNKAIVLSFCEKTSREDNPKGCLSVSSIESTNTSMYFEKCCKKYSEIKMNENDLLNTNGKTYLDQYWMLKHNFKERTRKVVEDTSMKTDVHSSCHKCASQTSSGSLTLSNTIKAFVGTDKEIDEQTSVQIETPTTNIVFNTATALLTSTDNGMCDICYNLTYTLNNKKSKPNATSTVSTDVNVNESVSTDANVNESVSTDVNVNESVSTDVNVNESVSTDVNVNESVSTDVNVNESVSTDVNVNESMSTDVNVNESASTDVNVNESVIDSFIHRVTESQSHRFTESQSHRVTDSQTFQGEGADIQDVHYFMSPDCPMVTGHPCENIAWPARSVQESDINATDIALAYYSSMGINLKAPKPRKIVLPAHDK
uniref:Uncharacterized protein n=1 Tax=Biomphalaria glabrata TaxID=6526 RepID=A0A2C9LXT8_BIOGL